MRGRRGSEGVQLTNARLSQRIPSFYVATADCIQSRRLQFGSTCKARELRSEISCEHSGLPRERAFAATGHEFSSRPQRVLKPARSDLGCLFESGGRSEKSGHSEAVSKSKDAPSDLSHQEHVVTFRIKLNVLDVAEAN